MSDPRLRAPNTMLFAAIVDLALAAFFFFAGPSLLSLDRQMSLLIAGACVVGAVATALAAVVMRKKALAAIAAERGPAAPAGDRPAVWRRHR